jgi:hypothetical protein
MRFEAEIHRFDGTTPVIGVDIHEDGARVLSKRNWPDGTLLFLKLTEVQLGGFVEVRHSTLRKDGRYAIGLAFRGPMVPQGETWQIQRVCTTGAWTRKDDAGLVRKPREVA